MDQSPNTRFPPNYFFFSLHVIKINKGLIQQIKVVLHYY